MKARLAKKIIKASGTYCFYCRNCDTHSRYKYHPYWTSHWNYRAYMTRYPTTIVKSYDQRLDLAIRRLPQYTRNVLSAVKVIQMEIKVVRQNRAWKRFIQQVLTLQSGKGGNGNGSADFSISSKMESL